jgi:hypothetical protein
VLRGDTYLWAVDHVKPYIVCESGYAQGKVVATAAGKYRPGWVEGGHSLIQNAQAAVKAYVS